MKKDKFTILSEYFVLVHFKGETIYWLAFGNEKFNTLIRRLNFNEFPLLKNDLTIVEKGVSYGGRKKD